jgi:hypothetical protein
MNRDRDPARDDEAVEFAAFDAGPDAAGDTDARATADGGQTGSIRTGEHADASGRGRGPGPGSGSGSGPDGEGE